MVPERVGSRKARVAPSLSSTKTMQYLGHPYTNKLFIVYLKFKFNWAPYILPDNPRPTALPLFITEYDFVKLPNQYGLKEK